MNRRRSVRWAALGGAVAMVAMLGASPGVARAATQPVGTATLLAAEADPGVQLIQTTFSATLAVPTPDVNQAALNNLESQVVSEVQSGTIGSDQTSIVNAIVDAIDGDPITYLSPTASPQTANAQIVGLGTGWVVTPDGYMITADHVVDPGTDELKSAFAQQGLTTFNQQDAQQIESSAEGGGITFTGDQLAKLEDAAAKYNAHYLQISNVTTAVAAQLGTAVTGLGKGTKPLVVDVISKGSPYPGKDVAVLKAEGQTDMPTIPLGSDSDVNQGDELFVDGYPAASTFESGESPGSQVQATQTEGPLTAKKNAANTNMPIFQIQAPISPGSSGSPVFDAAGNAVGMAVAGAVDENGAQVPGQEFAIPISIVDELLNQSNIHPSASLTTTTYNKALNDYFRQYYKRALPLFQQVKALYPGHPYVDDYISNSQTAISQGKDRTPSSSPLALILIIIVVLLVVGGAATFFVRRRKSAGPSGPSGVAAPMPTAPYPVTTPAGGPEAPMVSTAPVAPGAVEPEAFAPTEPMTVPGDGEDWSAASEAPTVGQSSAPGPSFCASCGAAWPAEARFCPSCGASRV